MTKKIIIAAIGVCLIFSLIFRGVYPASAQGQGQITVGNNNVKINYPESITFSCHVQDSVNVTDIRLEYQVEQMSFAQVTSEAEITFTPSASIDASYELNMAQYGQIPSGVNVNYWWKIKDAAGDILQTTPTSYTVYDNNHTWSTMTQGKINIYWYGQDQAFGQKIMTEAQTALSIISNATGGTLDQAANISIYTSVQDYAASVLGVPEWSGGVTLSQYNSIFVVVQPNDLGADLPAVAHEMTHVIEGQLSFNPYNSLPFWLNEGLAVYVQFTGLTLPAQFTSPLSSAIANNTLISVRSLSDPFSAYPNQADLSYAQSVSIVTYLIDQYGSAKINQLLETFRSGSTYDGALETVYGFNMDGLFAQWKTWVSTHDAH